MGENQCSSATDKWEVTQVGVTNRGLKQTIIFKIKKNTQYFSHTSLLEFAVLPTNKYYKSCQCRQNAHRGAPLLTFTHNYKNGKRKENNKIN